ncbi:mono/diheme cytochrome c family protein [Humitalea rosea]|uniref:Mono/diheme cytochrome c family protein n=1 Tax=Humitalea rosea TaxID=990373 RepID=A0A2W7JVB7_9PROT|nr:cytochrome c [Humitalea rosea]PZW39390.1 mono/diheme cytochrome c family protein [Humitalea rosea]
MTRVPRVVAGFVALAMTLGGVAPAAAQPVGDGEAGRRLAETWCASCHAVTSGGRGTATDATPGFPTIAAMPSTTAMSLRVFLRTPHDLMPDLHLSRQQTDDLITYILSLADRH